MECHTIYFPLLYTDLLISWYDVGCFQCHSNVSHVDRGMANCSSLTAGTVMVSLSELQCKWLMLIPLLSLSYLCAFDSCQATGPFLQLGAVGALTLLSPFVFNGFHNAQDKCMFRLVLSMLNMFTPLLYACWFSVTNVICHSSTLNRWNSTNESLCRHKLV